MTEENKPTEAEIVNVSGANGEGAGEEGTQKPEDGGATSKKLKQKTRCRADSGVEPLPHP